MVCSATISGCSDLAQFDVYLNPIGAMDNVPFVVDVQADHLDRLPARMVIPLGRPNDTLRPTRQLNPLLSVTGEPLVLITQHAAAVPARVLGRKIASLADHRSDIIAALDFLFTGV
ncbi:MAG: CcdB family protein [Rhodospirillaceae bacterium]|nr:CcdB family protein [Rhodospirillales bacterium]